MSRIIIFTGKGGVGKTSVVAAHALRAARGGMNTLLVSADMAHWSWTPERSCAKTTRT